PLRERRKLFKGRKLMGNEMLALLDKAINTKAMLPRRRYTPDAARQIRRDANVSLEVMATAVDVTSRSVWNWERARTWPHPRSALRWQRATHALDLLNDGISQDDYVSAVFEHGARA